MCWMKQKCAILDCLNLTHFSEKSVQNSRIKTQKHMEVRNFTEKHADTHWSINWLIDWLNDWSIEWLIEQSVKCFPSTRFCASEMFQNGPTNCYLQVRLSLRNSTDKFCWQNLLTVVCQIKKSLKLGSAQEFTVKLWNVNNETCRATS